MSSEDKLSKIHPPLTPEALAEVDRFIFPAINKLREVFGPLAEDNNCERELTLVLNSAHAVPSLAKEVRAGRATPPTSLVGSESPAKPVPVPRTVLQAATEAGRKRFPEWETNPEHGRAASVYAQGYLEHFRVTALGGVSSPGGEAGGWVPVGEWPTKHFEDVEVLYILHKGWANATAYWDDLNKLWRRTAGGNPIQKEVCYVAPIPRLPQPPAFPSIPTHE